MGERHGGGHVLLLLLFRVIFNKSRNGNRGGPHHVRIRLQAPTASNASPSLSSSSVVLMQRRSPAGGAERFGPINLVGVQDGVPGTLFIKRTALRDRRGTDEIIYFSRRNPHSERVGSLTEPSLS